VYGIVKQSGRDARVQSEPSHGSAYTISVPLVGGDIRDQAPSRLAVIP
jgi:signal transduction histidine kinase